MHPAHKLLLSGEEESSIILPRSKDAFSIGQISTVDGSSTGKLSLLGDVSPSVSLTPSD